MARTATLQKQPFAGFVGINANTLLDQLKRSGRQNQHSDWAAAVRDAGVNVRVFEGEVSGENSHGSGGRSNSVYCNELECKIRFHPNNLYRSEERDPLPKSTVKFAIGINDHGLWAYGLHTVG